MDKKTTVKADDEIKVLENIQQRVVQSGGNIGLDIDRHIIGLSNVSQVQNMATEMQIERSQTNQVRDIQGFFSQHKELAKAILNEFSNSIGQIMEKGVKLWDTFKDLDGKTKAMVIFAICALVALVGISSWTIYAYGWDKILNFVKLNGMKITMEMGDLIMTIGNSPHFAKFCGAIKNGTEIPMEDIKSLISQSSPHALKFLKLFFTFLNANTKSNLEK